jgi:exosortase A-associated hydrolase 2
VGATLEAFFLPAGEGRTGERFCIHHRPATQGAVRGAFVYLHPFAEEMNKSRRMAAWQARALAAAGIAVIQIDLLGCGDSSGDFADATWADWIADATLAHRWLHARHGVTPGFWGLRAGCLLAAEAARGMQAPLNFLFWQPVTSGKTLLAQFLRLKTAAALLEGGARDPADDPRKALARGEVVEVAGYRLAPALAQGLEQAMLAPPATAGRGLWIEVDAREDDDLMPATRKAMEAWRQPHRDLASTRVRGPAFWQTQEIEDVPALVDATISGLHAWGAA